MPEKVSRRRLIGSAATVAVASTVVASQKAPTPADKLSELEAQLVEKLQPDVRKIASESLAGIQRNTAARLKVRLPENSEPCYIYQADRSKAVK